MTAVPYLASLAASLAPEAAPKLRAADFDKLFDEITAGRLPVPNFEEMDLAQGVGSIAAGSGMQVTAPKWGARIEGSDKGGHFARFFLNTTQGGQFDGSGLVMLMTGSGGKIGRFAICKHSKVAGPGANPNRGWHPGRCEHCGLDMTVDSGD